MSTRDIETKSYLGNQSVAFAQIAHQARAQALQAAQQTQPATQTNQATQQPQPPLQNNQSSTATQTSANTTTNQPKK